MIGFGSMSAKLGETVYVHFPVYDGNFNKLSGLNSTHFTKTLEYQGVIKTTDFTFSGPSEVGTSGDYASSIALALAGFWSMEIKQTSTDDLWRWEFDIATAEAQDITDLVLDITRGETVSEMRVPLGRAQKYRWRAPGDKSGLANVILNVYNDSLAHITGSPFAMAETSIPGLYQTSTTVAPSTKGRYLLHPVAPSLGAQGKGRLLHLEVVDADTGTGIEPVIIKVVDSGNVPIPEVGIAIYNTAETLMVSSGKTDVSGLDGRFALAQGAYKVRLGKAGAGFTNPYSITVAAGGGTFTLTGTPQLATTPGSLLLCGVYGTVTNGSGVNQANIPVEARVFQAPSGVGIVATTVTVNTNSNGFFQLDLYRAGIYDIFIPKMDYRKRITVPSQELHNLFT